ncbi:uncharacterized protein LOC131353073 [Hemibagrus wyckioides]|nr:uncharacterized protein LOC131353073 [Hemibagrus wyckioides]XP_058245775.1 uncharacterized protein LOC131353073 [Hemibagrus wyckioides]
MVFLWSCGCKSSLLHHHVSQLAHRLRATEKQNIRLPSINKTTSTPPLIIIEEFEQAGAGLAAKNSGKPRFLPRRQRMDQISPLRDMIHREMTDDQTRKKFSKPQKKLSDKMEPVASTYRKNYTASHEVVETFSVPGDRYSVFNSVRDLSDTEERSKSPEATTEEEHQIRADITDTVLQYVNSTSFKNQLSLHIMSEIDAKIAKAVSQVQNKQHAVRFATARDEELYYYQEQQSSNNLSTPGFSEGVASLIGYALMEVREKMKSTLTSHKRQTESPPACNTVKETVDRVFESMLDSLIPVNDDNSHLNQDSTDGDSSMIDTLASCVYDAASESILHSSDSDDICQILFYDLESDDKVSSITDQDMETLDTVKIPMKTLMFCMSLKKNPPLACCPKDLTSLMDLNIRQRSL